MKIEAVDWSKAKLKKISTRIDGHATSVSIEPYFIEILTNEANKNGSALNALIKLVDKKRPPEVNLSAALRIFALNILLNKEN